MNFLRKLLKLFFRTKEIVVNAKLKVDSFIKEHRKQIKFLMTVLEALFPAQTGAKKMACVVTNVCMAIGYEAAAEDVIEYIEDKCQKIYDEFKEGLEDNG